MSDASLAGALSEWEHTLGGSYVARQPAALEAAERATFATTASVRAILRPASRDEVASCLKIANRHQIPIYPISTGKNWGYGSRSPVQSGVILDLGRLNRIVDYDEQLAYVTLEPGVTQRQLFAYLAGRGSRLWMDASGASPDCSVVGNTLERGFGHTPMADHCANACGLEIVLPSGDIVETGFARFPGAKAAPVSRWGVGPWIDGLFSQSNLGVVTRMTIWLMPAPEHFEAFFFQCNDPRGVGPIVDALRPLRLDGTLRGVSHIGNDYKVVTATQRYPWELMSGRTPLDQENMERIRRRASIGAWNGSGALYGSHSQVRAAKTRVRKALRGKVDRLQFVNDRLLRTMKRFAAPFRLVTGWDVSQTVRILDSVYGLMKGVPTDDTLSSAYWRKRGDLPSELDPDRDGCGLLWCSPVAPLSGEHLTRVADVATAVLLRHGFEPQISISLASERSAICVITVSYDREVAGEDARALAAYRELAEDLQTQGYPPYRLTVRSMDLLSGADGPDVVGVIKGALDPRRVLAPGRYESSSVRNAG
jgi:4-cresol dehydrogenase (hydroxylating)